jgi:hypothetical protein
MMDRIESNRFQDIVESLTVVQEWVEYQYATRALFVRGASVECYGTRSNKLQTHS